ncbi:MAG: hypothetical protein RI554_10580 [Trueperaceae bacterium]|nr:hypothetical protein [Trueperaceae bacterium]
MAFLALSTSASANIGIVEDLTATLELNPGDEVTRTLTVFNRGDEPQRVRVTPYDRDPNTSSPYVAAGTLSASAASMITLEADEFVVAPGENRLFTFTVSVPEDARDARTVWSTLMFTPVGPLQEEAAPTEGIQVRTRTRIAYAVLVHVGNPTAERIVIGDVAAGTSRDPSSDELLIDASLHVEGQRATRVAVQAQVFDRSTGEQVFATPPAETRLYPGYDRDVRFDLSDVEPGAYEILLLAETKDDDLYAVRFDLDVGQGQGE